MNTGATHTLLIKMLEGVENSSEGLKAVIAERM